MGVNQPFKNYLQTFFCSSSSLLLSILAFNLIIDPYGDFRLVEIDGINKEKVLAYRQGGRRKKANDILHDRYDTVILGTSRAVYALNPKHSAFAGQKVYNLGLTGTNMYEIYQTYQYARQHQDLDLVVFSLDFLAFSNHRTISGDFNKSRFSSKRNLFTQLTELMSLYQIEYSLETIHDNQEGRVLDEIEGFLEQDSEELNHRQAFDRILKERFFIARGTYTDYVYSQQRLELFRKIVADCLANDIELRLFISPVHARQLEAIAIMELFPTFEQWKRDLVNIVAEEAQRLNKTPPLFWDFSGYNSITTEAIPPHENKTEMQWYLESSHYNRRLGDLLLDIVGRYPQSVDRAPDDFGTLITVDNIENHLTHIRQQQAIYRRNYPFEVAEVAKLFQQANQKQSN
jgi:hypothetical protein